MLERHEHGKLLELRLARPPVNALSPALIAALRDKRGPQVTPPSARRRSAGQLPITLGSARQIETLTVLSCHR